MRRYLVVANQTLGGAHLAEAVRRCMDRGPCAFHIVVPASRPPEHFVWTEGQARAIAADRLAQAATWFRQIGAEATGEVGDQQPMLAIADALIATPFDEIILSTLPAGLSRWLHQDLPNRVRRHYGLPVMHVAGDPMSVAQTA